MNREEALEYLGRPAVLHIKRPGADARCDEAVEAVCEDYRHNDSVPKFHTIEPARRACSILLTYAAVYFSDAALAGQSSLLDKGLVAMDVADATRWDMAGAARILDRFIVLMGSERSETLLLMSAARMQLSAETKALIRSRLARLA